MRAQRRRATRIVTTYFEDRVVRQRAWATGRYPMPKVFCLEENYEESAQALVTAREMIHSGILRYLRMPHLKRIRPRHIANFMDFTTIERFSPSAALLLASEFHRARLLMPIWRIPLIDIEMWRKSVVATLEDIGFFALLEIGHPSSKATNTRIARFSSGKVASGSEAKALFDKLANLIRGLDAGEELDATLQESRMRLYGALVEATENTAVHAYEGVDDPEVVNRWWMTGAVDSANKQLTIIVYDQGLSIPACLPSWKGYGWIEKAFLRLYKEVPPASDESYDALRIRLAMDAPVSSSSGLIYRGKGFPAYKAVVNHCRAGRLRILSRRGEFIYEKGRHAEYRSVTTSLQGTLIEWNLTV